MSATRQRTDPFLLVERALKPDDRREVVLKFKQLNPNMAGAHCADVLGICEDRDAFLGDELFWDEYSEAVEHLDGKIIRASVIAGTILEREHEWTYNLILKASS